MVDNSSAPAAGARMFSISVGGRYRIMAKQRVNVRWRNRLSGETGYVKSVKAKLGHFENTWEQTEAKKYISEKAANNDIVLLNEIGEGKDNDFEIVQA